MKIMICDDAGFVRVILANICQELGHSVVESCGTTRELRAHLDRHVTDVIFLDVVLPEQDGLSFFKNFWLAEDNPFREKTTIVFMSSLGIEFMNDKLRATIESKAFGGEVYFLNKPFEKNDIAEIFQTLELAKKRAG